MDNLCSIKQMKQDESHKSISDSYNIPKLKSNYILNEENQAYFEDL